MATERGMKREDAEPVVVRAPLERAVVVGMKDTHVPPGARRLAATAIDRGWFVRITHARGYDPTMAGKAIWELTGEFTENDTPRKKRIGTEEPEPVNSLRLVIRTPGRILVGHWIDKRWDGGRVMAGNVLVANVNWSGLREAFDAESEAHVRGEDPRIGWVADQLPLGGDPGSAL